MKGNQRCSFEAVVRRVAASEEERADLLCECEDLMTVCRCANSANSQVLDVADELVDLAKSLAEFGLAVKQRLGRSAGEWSDFLIDLDVLSVQASDTARNLIDLSSDLLVTK